MSDVDKEHWVNMHGEVYHLTTSEAELLRKQKMELHPSHLLERIRALEDAFHRLMCRLERAAERD